MTAHGDHRTSTPPARSRHRLAQAWIDLSLRGKLLVFAVGLVTLPGIVFALFAFAGARAALEREVGIQLHQTAERGADALAAALDGARNDARAWAGQDVMRELLVGDVDKRVSRFLQTLVHGPYLHILCVDTNATVVAASSGKWIGENVGTWSLAATAGDAERMRGPIAAPEPGESGAPVPSSGSAKSGTGERAAADHVVEIVVPVANPDPPGGRIGHLVLVYDWGEIDRVLGGIRAKLTRLDKQVAALVVDGGDRVLGGVDFDGRPARHSALAAAAWPHHIAGNHGQRTVRAADDTQLAVLIGAAPVSAADHAWTVLFVEHADEALAAVKRIRDRWTLMVGLLLLIGVGGAAILARQVMRPLSEVTRATTTIAAQPDLELPLLPVQSRSEVGQLTDSFNRMTTALKHSRDEALSAAKFAFAGELAAMVAHEVRTPLSVMRSSAQMLAAPAHPHDGENAELAQTIVAEVDRVERVVTGLIELARPMQQRLEPTAVGELLSRAAAFVAAQAQRQHITVHCDTAADQRLARCDPEQIYQVILNLLVNALQALPAGSAIWLRTLPSTGDTVSFEVGDDGPGLPREIRDRIFQPFVTGREHGTGLGLAFVDRIIKAHRGTVAVHSEPGHGTVFRVNLPAAGNTELE